jgi:lipopolysaccharide export system protein LptA
MRMALLVIFMVSGWGWVSPLFSEPLKEEPKEEEGSEHVIHVTSDAAESDHRMGWLEFTGNVRATQEESVITADRIKIFYKTGKNLSTDRTTVEKIVSRGNVKIVFDDKTKTALADKAVYTAHPKILTLSGRDTTVRSGENVVRGEKITLFLAENRTVVEGGDEGQVEATFFDEDAPDLAE